PKDGPALLVGNHPSYLDPLWLGVIFTDRPVRFLMYRAYYEKAKWLMRLGGVIPVAGIEEGNGHKSIFGSLALAREALRRGEIVTVFGEGQVTRNGAMSTFRRGMEAMVRGLNVPVIPFHLDGPWGGPFSWRAKIPWRFRLQQGRRLIQLRVGQELE